MRIILVSLIFTFLLAQNLFANNERDSLLNLLEKHNKEDKRRVNLLIETAWHHWFSGEKDYNHWFSGSKLFPYAIEANQLAKKLNYKTGLLESQHILIKVLIETYENLDSAKVILNEMEKIKNSENSGNNTCLYYLCLMEYHLFDGDYAKVIQIFNENSPGKIKCYDKYLTINMNLWASAAYIMLGDSIEASKLIEKAKNSIPGLSNKIKKTYLLYWESMVFLNYFGDYNQYNQTYNLLIESLRVIGDKEAMANIIYYGGVIAHNYGNYSKSIENAFRALELYRELADTSGIATINSRLAWLYYLVRAYEQAKKFGLIGLRLFSKLGKNWEIANTMYNLGLIYEGQDSLELAEEYFLKSLGISSDIKNDFLVGLNYTGLASIADKQGNFDEAEQFYQKILEDKWEFGLPDLARIYPQLAYHYYLLENEKKALYYADSAFVISKSTGAIELQMRASEVLYKIFQREKNDELAFKYLLIYVELNSALKKNEAKELGLIHEYEQRIQQERLVQENKNILNERELKYNKAVRNLFIGGFLITLLLFIILLRYYIHKKKTNELLTAQKLAITAKNEELIQQKEEITTQRDQLSKQNNSINESIHYAKRIQTAVLPQQAYIDEILMDNFILYKPRDVVSGDFYWIRQINHFIVIAVADCTGHGVPGAIMSMLGISFLNEIVQKREITKPDQVLNELRKQLKHSLKQTGREGGIDDGMDIALCTQDTKTNHLQFAGANNPLYLVQNNKLIEIQADRMPIGFYPNEKQSFTNHEIQLNEGDVFYLFTDGFMDQFGGEKGMKYKATNLQRILLENHNKPMLMQKEKLEQELHTWMKGHGQTDDILVMGVRV